MVAVIDGDAWLISDDETNYYRKLLKGWLKDGNAIAPYQPPTAGEKRARMPPLDKWQLYTVIDLETAFARKQTLQLTMARAKSHGFNPQAQKCAKFSAP